MIHTKDEGNRDPDIGDDHRENKMRKINVTMGSTGSLYANW